MSESGGGILFRERYEQAKMLDHSGWKLPRGITPSDIDMVVESRGCTLFVELTRKGCDWRSISIGQQMLYDSLVKTPGNAVALAKHSVQVGEDIDTREDIQAVAIRWAEGTKGMWLDRNEWRHLVHEWARDPVEATAWLNHVHVVREAERHYRMNNKTRKHQ